MRKLLTIILILCMTLLTACGASSNVAYSVKYNLKINPEFEVYADKDLKVTKIEALNDDGETLLSNLNVTGMSVQEAFTAITEEAKAEGFMTAEKGNTVNITMEDYDEDIIEVCPVCGGCGTVECWTCHESGRLECMGCHGSLMAICEDCHGKGTVESNGICQTCGGSEHLTCIYCDGGGWADCDQCGGTGQVKNDCDQCGGTGLCNLCDGEGWQVVTNGDDGGVVVDEDGEAETGRCEACHGTGECQKCHAGDMTFCNACCEHKAPDGSIVNAGGIPGKDHCKACDGTGIMRCPDCDGENAGKEVCEKCGGSGTSACNNCEQRGYIICGCSLNGRQWCGCCWGSGVKGTGHPDYDISLSPEENYNLSH